MVVDNTMAVTPSSCRSHNPAEQVASLALSASDLVGPTAATRG